VKVSDIRFTAAPKALRGTGLYAFAQVLLDGRWEVDGIAIRRSLEGALLVTFPARKDGSGAARPYFRPVDPEARAAIEVAVLHALREWRSKR